MSQTYRCRMCGQFHFRDFGCACGSQQMHSAVGEIEVATLLTPEEVAALRAEWEKLNTGPQRGRVLVLPNGATIQRVAPPDADAPHVVEGGPG